MSSTPKLSLPYIMPAQAQKHITHNEALKILDALIQTSVQKTISSLPEAPEPGECYFVKATQADALANHNNAIVQFYDDHWTFYQPKVGWRIWHIETKELLVFEGAEWKSLSDQTSSRLGLNAQADNFNRLAVSAPASLFSHEGNSHQLKINKASANDTASTLYQSDWTGHAELGLTGDNDFHVKVSPDGVSWSNALRMDNITGQAQFIAGVQLGASNDVLDIYETGQWTPEIYGTSIAGTPSYTVNLGQYMRLGRFVFVSCQLIWTSLGEASGQMRVGGLPFKVASGNSNRAAITVSWYNSLTLDSGVTWLGGFGAPGTNHMRLWGANTPRNDSNNLLSESDLSDNGELYFTMSYLSS